MYHHFYTRFIYKHAWKMHFINIHGSFYSVKELKNICLQNCLKTDYFSTDQGRSIDQVQSQYFHDVKSNFMRFYALRNICDFRNISSSLYAKVIQRNPPNITPMCRECDCIAWEHSSAYPARMRLLDTRIAVVCKPGGSTTGRGSGLQLLLRFVCSSRTHAYCTWKI